MEEKGRKIYPEQGRRMDGEHTGGHGVGKPEDVREGQKEEQKVPDPGKPAPKQGAQY